MGKGFARKKKEARAIQDQFAKLQEELKSTEATGSAGNGLVTVTLTGENEMKSIIIKRECVDPDDIEGLQDLIRAAHKDAHKKVQESIPGMSEMANGSLPDLSAFGF